MGLELNEPRSHYKEHYGRVVDQMPKLIEEGRTPLSVADLMERRLNSQRTDWRDNYFFLGDAIAYSSDDKGFKVIVDAEQLRELTPQSNLRNGALVLADGVYEGLKGTEFSRKDIQSISNRRLKPKEAKKHPVWQTLAREQGLLDSYVDSTFAEMKERFGYTDGMGIYVEDPKGFAGMRAWFVDWLRVDRSNAGGGVSLGYVIGRLVGVALEAQSASNEPVIVNQLEQKVQQALGSKTAFKHNGTLYVPVREESDISVKNC